MDFRESPPLASSVHGLCGLHSQSSVQRMSSLVQQPVFQLLTPLSMGCCIKARFLMELLEGCLALTP